jgi:hypothetical protein
MGLSLMADFLVFFFLSLEESGRSGSEGASETKPNEDCIVGFIV